MIKLSQVYSKTNVMIAFQHQYIPENSLQITEIVYKCHDHWRIRDAKFLYQHPSEYITIKSPPYSMPIYKLFIDLYYDDFGTYRNVYHSLRGVYIQFGNMPTYQRKLIKNHFILGFVPFGGNFNEFILPFISKMKKLEQGKIMMVQGQNAWVIASLGVVTADLSQGNDLVGVLRHNATKGCRTCTISQELLTDCTQDISKTFEKPKNCVRLPNPISHHASFMMSDYLRLAIIMPFLLQNFLKDSSLKNNDVAIIQERLNIKNQNNAVSKYIISCWVHIAKIMKAVFSNKFKLNGYKEL